jgi:hypothetical protein
MASLYWPPKPDVPPDAKYAGPNCGQSVLYKRTDFVIERFNREISN